MSIKISYNFVAFPREIWDKNIDLTLGEFRLLGYLLRHQLRFGIKAAIKMTDDEIMHGKKEKDGKRMDKGCGLTSPNSIKDARDRLLEKRWIKMTEDLSDKARPKRTYIVLVEDDSETSDSDGEVSDSDTLKTNEFSSNDSTPSESDSTLSRSDTQPICKPAKNKEKIDTSIAFRETSKEKLKREMCQNFSSSSAKAENKAELQNRTAEIKTEASTGQKSETALSYQPVLSQPQKASRKNEAKAELRAPDGTFLYEKFPSIPPELEYWRQKHGERAFQYIMGNF